MPARGSQGSPGGAQSWFACVLSSGGRTETRPLRCLPWARRWRAQSGTSWWPLGAQKSRSRAGFHFSGAQFRVLVAHGKGHCLGFVLVFAVWEGLRGTWHLVVAVWRSKRRFPDRFLHFWGPVWCSGRTLEKYFFDIFVIFGCRQGCP